MLCLKTEIRSNTFQNLTKAIEHKRFKMKNIARVSKLLVCFTTIILFQRCGFADLKGLVENANKITSVLQNNCNCEEVSMVKYSIENFTTTATYKLVGCEFEEFEEEALRVKVILSDSIPDFCEIQYFNLVFVNKGVQKVKRYSKCKEM